MADEETRQSAIALLSKQLKFPEDLHTKMPLLKKRYASELSSLSAQLASQIQLSVSNVHSGMDVLVESERKIDLIRENLGHVEQLSREASNLIDNFEYINQISRCNQNFSKTRQVLEKFQDLDGELERVKELLDQDDREDEIPSCDNVLLVHYYLWKLEDFRCRIMAQMQDSTSDIILVLQRYFQKLDVLADRFNVMIWRIVARLDWYAMNGQGDVVVKIAKIIEKEEKEDELALEVQQGVKSDKEAARQAALFNSFRLQRERKNYRSKLFDTLNNSIITKFRTQVKESINEISECLDKMNFFVQDLDMIKEIYEPRFPPKYRILDYLVTQYHRNIYDILNSIITKDIGPSDILQIIGWVKEYYEIMAERFAVESDLLEPPLLDKKEPMLIQEYMTMSKQKLNEWIGNLMQAEEKKFVNREGAPETDSNGKYFTTAAIDLFQIVKQHLDPVSNCTKGRLLFDVVMEISRGIQSFQKGMIAVMEREAALFAEKEDSIAAGFEDYVIMIANSCLRFIEFMDEISKQIENDLDDSFKIEATAALKACNDGFLKVAKTSNQILLDCVFKLCKPLFPQFFTSTWYGGEVQETIFATFDDYLIDYVEKTEEYLFGKLVMEILEKFILSYLDALRSKNAKLKDNFIEIMQDDYQLLVEFFSKYRPQKRIQRACEPIEKIISLLGSSEDSVFLDFYALFQAYADVPFSFIEEILAKRNDLEKAQLKAILETCKAKMKEEKSSTTSNTQVASVFSKLGKGEKTGLLRF